MNRRFRIPGLGRRNALIALGVVIALGGSGTGLYLYARAQLGPLQTTKANRLAYPAAPPVGAQSVAKAREAIVLTVVTTSPARGSVANALDTSITLRFNLPVDPAALKGYFYLLPNVTGAFSQGKAPQDVVFKPSSKFAAGSSVAVTLHSGLTSRGGVALKVDYSFSFTTLAGPRSVLFIVGGAQQAMLVNALSGRSVSMEIQTGEQVPSDTTVKTYRANSQDLLAALVYSSTADPASRPEYLDLKIDTASMRLVDNGGTYLTASGARTNAVQSGVAVTVSQPAGIYLILASDAQGQYGAVWVVFSRYGVILRQDDQKIVVAGEDLTTGDTAPNFKITFYSLLKSVQPKLSGSFAGTAEFPATFPAGFDVAIATAGGEDVVVPLSAPETGADIKVVANLAQEAKIYLTTDRPAYQKGDTLRFGGVVRLSNDQAYSLGAGMKVAVSTYVTQANLAVATVAADGTFSGSFLMPSAAFNADGTDNQLTVTAAALSTGPSNPFVTPSAATVVALGPHSPSARLTVRFDKTSYVVKDTIVVSISGVNANGQPLAGQTLNLTIYSTQHAVQPQEMDSFLAPSVWGEVVLENVKVRLDATGHATYSTKANVAQAVGDQEVTVAVTYGSGPAKAVGARTAIVNQAGANVFLLASRSVYLKGDVVIAPFVVEGHSGQRVGNWPMAYELDSTDYSGDKATTTVVASGTLSTDANGMGLVRATYRGPTGQIVLKVKGKDASGNVFEDDRDLTVTDDPSDLVFFRATTTLLQLDVATDKIVYSVGDSAHLTVTSPTAQGVLLSLERGRVHKYQWVQLAKGNNSLTVNVTPDLAPGFTVMFSYFHGDAYVTEGLPVQVNNSNRLLKVTVTADKTSYAAGQTAHLTIAVADSSGAPVAATLLVDGYDSRMSVSELVDQASIAGAFLTPAPRGTNASSSLVGIGSWGGMCGGGEGLASPDPTNPGRLAVWLPAVTTDATGHATVNVPIPQWSVRVAVVGSTATSSWGQTEIDLNVQ